LLCSLLSISIIPTSIVSFELFQSANENAERALNEKHLNLAKSLAEPIYAYIENHRTIAQSLARKLFSNNQPDSEVGNFLESANNDFKNFSELAFLNSDNQITLTHNVEKSDIIAMQVKSTECVNYASTYHSGTLSPVIRNPFGNGSTVLFCEPVFRNQQLTGVLIGALDLDILEQYRSGVSFGKSGHSVIVDQNGMVVAHPNKKWMTENKNLSEWAVVKKMMQGETGVTEFFSNFTNEEMVAGFAAVPTYGWGIMVPQLKSEVDSQIMAMLVPHLKWGVFSACLALILSFFLSRWISRPMEQLVKGTRMLSDKRIKGDALRISRSSPKELTQLSRSLERLTRQFIQVRTKLEDTNETLKDRIDESTRQLRDQNSKLEAIANIDPLTGLPNRRGLMLRLEEEVAKANRNSSSFGLLLCDLDRFKLVNDNYGHTVGDNVLKAFSQMAPNSLKQGDIVGRWGGEEFLVILSGANAEASEKIAERIRKTMEDIAVLPDAIGLKTTVSIGLATYPLSSDAIEPLISCADAALYEAKHSGRNKVVVTKGKSAIFSVANQIRHALEENGIKSAFQTVFTLSNMQKVGQQSLARIICPGNEVLRAESFITQAKQLNLLPRIDNVILRKTLKYINNHYFEGGDQFAFVNLSNDFLHDETLNKEIVKQIKVIKQTHQIKNSFPLVIELNESQFKGKVSELKELISPYTAQGVKLALTNLEISSMGVELLTSLPFDFVKLDGSAMRLAMSNPRFEVALNHLLVMCRDLDLTVIAEQISTFDELNYCKSLEIELGQGYCLSRPTMELETSYALEI